MSNRETFVIYFAWNCLLESIISFYKVDFHLSSFPRVVMKLFVTPCLCFQLVVTDEETHALQVPYDISRPQGVVYDLTSFLRVYCLTATYVMELSPWEHHFFIQSKFSSLNAVFCSFFNETSPCGSLFMFWSCCNVLFLECLLGRTIRCYRVEFHLSCRF